mmetsp:Transcript_31351/g.47395  ORF Transcript_31351/g.47395 Transcript_31351/m.47395 type:complete len:402 (-) Transcript_31351:95-1300(-)
MGRVSYYAFGVAAIATTLLVTLNVSNNDIHHHRTLQVNTVNELDDARVIAQLSHPNETISEELSTAAHSYCNGNDLQEYPLPDYGKCSPNSTLNIIPFFGGMTNALKFVLLGALMSFEEDRCFWVSEANSHLNPGFSNGTSKTGESEDFLKHYFENIGLAHGHPFVQRKIELQMYEVRQWDEYWKDLRQRRTLSHTYNFTTPPYSHPEANVNGIALKRDFMRHMWHLKPTYRDQTCQTLRDQQIFDTDYIAMSVRRGDKTKENFRFPGMNEYITEAQRLIPHVFKNGQKPKIFVATDDCSVLPSLRRARPNWDFISQCDQIAETQNGYDIRDIPKLTDDQREEHFKKFFVELYAMALSKVFIGVAYTNVSWFAYMMRPNVDKSTFILLDKMNNAVDDLDSW